jgi:hypothetical protein
VQVEIVGVVGDFKTSNAKEKALPAVYRPILQVPDYSAYTATIHMRTLSDPAPLVPQVRQIISQIDDKLPIYEVTTLTDQMNERLNQERLIAQLVSFFWRAGVDARVHRLVRRDGPWRGAPDE